MKKLFYLCLTVTFVFSFIGCEHVNFGIPNPFATPPEDQPCKTYEEYGIAEDSPAFIPKRIKNPCDARKILVSGIKIAVLSFDKVEDAKSFVKDFHSWTAGIKEKLMLELTFADLNTLIQLEVAKFNGRYGLVYLTASELLLTLPQDELIATDDTKILLGAIDLLDDYAEKTLQLRIQQNI